MQTFNQNKGRFQTFHRDEGGGASKVEIKIYDKGVIT